MIGINTVNKYCTCCRFSDDLKFVKGDWKDF